MTTAATNLDPLERARAAVQYFAAERARRSSTEIPLEQLEAAAELLVDLWSVAACHRITADQAGHALHLPRAALDAVLARYKPQRGGSKR